MTFAAYALLVLIVALDLLIVWLMVKATRLRLDQAMAMSKPPEPPPAKKEPTLMELRGVIAQCRAVESALDGITEMPAPLVLADIRAKAAWAREKLSSMGERP
jgi:hypothetical protein